MKPLINSNEIHDVSFKFIVFVLYKYGPQH
jgi:hypothetical protein